MEGKRRISYSRDSLDSHRTPGQGGNGGFLGFGIPGSTMKIPRIPGVQRKSREYDGNPRSTRNPGSTTRIPEVQRKSREVRRKPRSTMEIRGATVLQRGGLRARALGHPFSVQPQRRPQAARRDAAGRNLAAGNAAVHRAQPLAARRAAAVRLRRMSSSSMTRDCPPRWALLFFWV